MHHARSILRLCDEAQLQKKATPNNRVERRLSPLKIKINSRQKQAPIEKEQPLNNERVKPSKNKENHPVTRRR